MLQLSNFFTDDPVTGRPGGYSAVGCFSFDEPRRKLDERRSAAFGGDAVEPRGGNGIFSAFDGTPITITTAAAH